MGSVTVVLCEMLGESLPVMQVLDHGAIEEGLLLQMNSRKALRVLQGLTLVFASRVQHGHQGSSVQCAGLSTHQQSRGK